VKEPAKISLACYMYSLSSATSQMKKMHSLFAKRILGMQEKSSENFSDRQRTPEKQKGTPNSLELGPLTIKISGNSASQLV